MIRVRREEDIFYSNNSCSSSQVTGGMLVLILLLRQGVVYSLLFGTFWNYGIFLILSFNEE